MIIATKNLLVVHEAMSNVSCLPMAPQNYLSQVVRKNICITALLTCIILEGVFNNRKITLSCYERERRLAKVYQILVSPPNYIYHVNIFFNRYMLFILNS